MKLLRNPEHGARIDATDTAYPSDLLVITKGHEVADPLRTTYGYLIDGLAAVHVAGASHELVPGSFFCCPGRFTVSDVRPGSRVVLITRHGFRGMECFGRIEQRGRLSYIDGCSDSMLVYPPRLGDPVFNHLHFPPGIVQTQHTHPTIRLGIVARGIGHAFGPVQMGRADKWEEELSPSAVFMLEPQEMHSFRTDRTKTRETMDVIAYHPDSDWGPTDTAHPMRNRTYIGANPFNTGG